MSQKKKPALKSWVVDYKITGTAHATVKAATKEEAEAAAWEHYHSGVDLEDVEWGVDDLNVEEGT